MTREDVIQALARINEAIASLNARLHPPPLDPNQRQELEAELTAAENSRDNLEQVLNNLPEAEVVPAFAAVAKKANALRISRVQAESDAAIKLSKTARKHAENLRVMALEPVNGPQVTGGIVKPKKKTAH